MGNSLGVPCAAVQFAVRVLVCFYVLVLCVARMPISMQPMLSSRVTYVEVGGFF